MKINPVILERLNGVWRGWAIVMRWLIAFVILAFALIGFLHVTRGTAVRHVQGVSADGEPVGVGDPHFPLLVTMMTGAWLADGHQVDVILNGDGTYERLWDDLRSAERSITLQIYYGAPGRMSRELTEILTERARAGVRVVVLYDAFGTATMPAEERKAMTAAGVRTQAFRPLRLSSLHLAQHRSHVRGVVIDSRIGWTGGFGIDDKWFGDGITRTAWRETNVRFTGPAVRQLQAAFAAAWVEATGVLYTGRATLNREEGGTATAGLLFAAPTLGSTTAERFYALSIAGAQHTLYLTNAYFVPGPGFVQLLSDAARRGVDVRILTAGPRTDVGIVRSAGRASYEALLSAGVRIYEWQPTTLHAKTFVADGQWTTIGSMNFDNRSMALNDESTLMVLDAAVGAEMERVFIEDLQHAQEITLSEFQKRSWLERIAEGAATLVARLL